MNLKPKIDFKHFERCFTAIDTHTMGEFTRVVIGGFPEIPGDTMIEKRNYIVEHYDQYRRALMFEPRGHNDMFGAIVLEPVHAEADYGVLFMESETYTNMCGHGSIGTATALVEAGLVEVREPFTEVVLDTAAGVVHTRVKVENGRAQEVTITNVPSFLYKDNLEIDIDGYRIPYAISFGGQFIPLVDARKLGVEICTENIPFFTDVGIKMLGKIPQEVEIRHPTVDIREVTTLEFYDESPTEQADMKNIVVFGKHQVDRSPCGTGTCAKMAMMHAHGRLGLHRPLINESVIGTLFRGELIDEVQEGEFSAVIPQITGSAYVTGIATYLIDPRDPLRYGFILGE